MSESRARVAVYSGAGLAITGAITGLTMLAAAGTVITALAVSSPAASQDATRGEQVFVKCQRCHSLDADGPQDEGPHLHGLFGRKAGAVESYTDYSEALKTSEIVWTEETLDEYLEKPKAFVEGTTMRFRGMRKEEDRQDLIVYLREATK